MKLGIKEGSVAVNPVVDFKMPKGKVHIMKPEELTKLLAHATDLTMPLIMFGAFGGLRTSEIKRLKWSDIRLEEDQLYVPPHKGTGEGKTSNAERWVQLTPPLRVCCEAMLKQRSRGLVLRGRCDVTLTRHRRQMYKDAKTTIPYNALRHSYGSHHLVHYDKPLEHRYRNGPLLCATNLCRIPPGRYQEPGRQVLERPQGMETLESRVAR